MARTAITVHPLSTSASTKPAETNGDTVNGHYIPNNGKTWLEVRNADTVNPQTISVGYPKFHGQDVDPLDYTIPASGTREFKLGDPAVHGTRTPIDVSNANIKIIARTL